MEIFSLIVENDLTWQLAALIVGSFVTGGAALVPKVMQLGGVVQGVVKMVNEGPAENDEEFVKIKKNLSTKASVEFDKQIKKVLG